MALIATLISHPERPAVTPELVRRVASALKAGAPQWLDDGIACDLPIADGADAGQIAAALKAELAGEPVDHVVQTSAGRRKKLLIADMDSTMIDQECIDELADFVGMKSHVAAITARAMNGEIAFEPALRERVALLSGQPLDIIDRTIENRITIASGARALVATMKRHGAYTALVSGGFTAFTGPIAARIGFDFHRANRLIEKDGTLTGEVAEPILGREAKRQTLLELAERLGIEPGEAIAVGDGANDLDMLSVAGSGVALHAKPAVAEAAAMRIDHGDLTALLYLQGYRREEFAETLS